MAKMKKNNVNGQKKIEAYQRISSKKWLNLRGWPRLTSWLKPKPISARNEVMT